MTRVYGRKPPALDVQRDHDARIRVHALCTGPGETVLGKFQVPDGQKRPRCPRCKTPMVSGHIIYDKEEG